MNKKDRIASLQSYIPRKSLRILLLLPLLILGSGSAGVQAARRSFGDSLSRFHQPRARSYHLQHVLLELTLDERQKSVSGTSTLTLRPLNPGLDTIEVDSAELKIESVTAPDGKQLPFEQTEGKLLVHLPTPADATELVTISIHYSGNPRKGLYFVTPDRAYPDKPVQIWSQGEVEDSHFWFPIYDYPNDKATSEGFYTVNADYTVISNGQLLGVQDNTAAHTKTFHWKEDVPHSTYLISVVVGKFEKYTEHVGQLPVEYYVPVGAGQEKALRSFHETPNAIRFFSEKIGIPYPYTKYSQVTVHDFVFGGMENISATTLTDRTLHDDLSEPQTNSVDLVTHELAHQWFGDLLTCADWAQIWLNEGFATFWADAYREYRYGVQDYRYSLYQQRTKYLEEDRQRYRRPMVTSFYTDPLDLFDRSAYEKGALVLDMLRFVLGDERFFAAISHYAKAHQQMNVVTDDLRKSVEETTGEDLRWFFDEWTSKSGYPELQITEQWDEPTHTLHLAIDQRQSVSEETPLFRMPVDVEFTTQSERSSKRIEFAHARDEFDFHLDSKPLMTRFDPDHRILDTVSFHKPVAELLYQVQNDPAAEGRIWAAEQLSDSGNNSGDAPDIIRALRQVLLQDPFWGVRESIAGSLGKLKSEAAREAIAVGLHDPDPRVRQASIRALGSFQKDARAAKLVESAYDKDKNAYVEAEAAFVIGKINANGARKLLQRAVKRNSEQDIIRRYALEGLAEIGDKKDWDTASSWISYGRALETRMAAVDALLKFANGQDEKTAAKLISLLGDPDFFVKQRAMAALAEGNFQQARTALMNSAQTEADSRVRRSARIALERLSVAAQTEPSPKGKTQLLVPSQSPRNLARQGTALAVR